MFKIFFINVEMSAKLGRINVENDAFCILILNVFSTFDNDIEFLSL